MAKNKVVSRPMIYAVDFDGTIVEHDFPRIGDIKPRTVAKMKEAREKGHIIIIWTCRAGEPLSEAVEFLKKNNIPFDYVNENPVVEFLPEGRKIFANQYWDDRAVDVRDVPYLDIPVIEEI